MRIIITEGQYKLIKENEEYIEQIKNLIETFDVDNINLAFQIAKGLKIKQSEILKEYAELFNIFRLNPTRHNLIKISNITTYTFREKRVPDILFRLPNLTSIEFDSRIKNLDNLVSFNGGISILPFAEIESIPNLEYISEYFSAPQTDIESLDKLRYVGGNLILSRSRIKSFPRLEEVGNSLYLFQSNIESLGNLTSVGGSLYIRDSKIESLGNLKYVGSNLDLRNTPLSKTTTEEEIRNKVEVKGNIYL